MSLKWNELPEDVLNEIILSVIRLFDALNPTDVAVIMWSLGCMDAPLDTLRTIQFVDCLCNAILKTLPNMKASEVAKVLWGLSLSGLSWDDLPPAIHWYDSILLNVLLIFNLHE